MVCAGAASRLPGGWVELMRDEGYGAHLLVASRPLPGGYAGQPLQA